MKRILIIDNSRSVTGAFKSIMAFCLRMKDSYEFHFAVPVGSGITEQLILAGFKVREIDFLEISRRVNTVSYPNKIRKNTRVLIEYITDNKIDLVHVNDMYNMIGVRLKKALGIPLIYHVRLKKDSYINKFYSWFSGRIKRSADQIICVSESAAADFPESDKKTVIYNAPGVEENLPTYDYTREEHFRIHCLGRLMQGKGQMEVVKAFMKILQEFPYARLKFIGGEPLQTPYGRKLLLHIQKFGLEHLIEFEDFNSNVESVYKSADLIVNFSYTESFSRICMEAQFYGVPIISSDSGGPREIIDHNKTGILVENRNVSALSLAIAGLIKDDVKRIEFAKAGYVHVRDKFSDENTIQKLGQVYQKLIK